VVVLVGLSAIAQPHRPCRDLRIRRGQQASIAERAKVLGRIKAVSGRNAEAAYRFALARCQMRLTAILDEGETMTFGDCGNRRHVGGLTIEVHRNDRRRSRRHDGVDGARIDGQPDRIDIGEDRPRADHRDRQRRVCGRERRGDHLVTAADPDRPERDGERVGASTNSHGSASLARVCEFVLERFDFGTEDEPATLDDATDGRLHDGGIVAWCQREEWDHGTT
jgi:hypothetical protein